MNAKDNFIFTEQKLYFGYISTELYTTTKGKWALHKDI